MRRVDYHRAPSVAMFGPNEISIFFPRTLQAEREFFRYKPSKRIISRQYIDKRVIYCRFPARAVQPRSDEWKFQDNCASTAGLVQVLTPKFHIAFMALCEGWLRSIASVMQGLVTLQNHRFKNRPFHFAKLCEIKFKFFSNVLADCCYIIIAAVPDPNRR